VNIPSEDDMSIKEHKWSDDTLSYISNHNDELQLSNASEWPLSLAKSDAIAISKHFNLLITEMPLNETVEQFDEFMREVK